MKNPILIVGATSGIARAVAECLAQEKHNLILAGRDLEELEKTAADLRIRHSIKAEVRRFEALDFAGHAEFFADCVRACDGPLFGVVLCHGVLVPQEAAQTDFDAARRMIDINYTSAVSVLNEAANYFESQKAGFICAVSSVAGDRGRPTNYIYGSTKAALNAYLEGMRARLARSGVAVTTVKPGFVSTKMTRGLKETRLFAKPERVGRDICRAVRKRRDVVYTPWFWWGIMTIVCSIPTFLFKRMKL